jgi:hypothetical protein
MKLLTKIIASSLFSMLASSAAALEQDQTSLDTGSDPTVLSNQAYAKYEYQDLNNGISSGTLRLGYVIPLGKVKDYGLRFQIPVMQVNGAGGDQSHALGDASLQLTHVFGLTRTHGWVTQAEAVFDTAARPELGTGKNVLKGTLVYVRFLADGAIFAPAWVQSLSVSGQSDRSKVNTTTMDFYYVPKLSDPSNVLAFDPAINHDWESKKSFASLAVTAGRLVGKAFGGNAIVFIKPTLFAGGNRPGSWGVELGYKVIGF